jgi:hypothetical protein
MLLSKAVAKPSRGPRRTLSFLVRSESAIFLLGSHRFLRTVMGPLCRYGRSECYLPAFLRFAD